MPKRETTRRARKAKAEGKSPSTQASEFVREEIEHVRQGKHGARSAKQAVAIGLSKARRAGVDLPPPRRGSRASKLQAQRDAAKGRRKVSKKRSRATRGALEREGTGSASGRALSRQAKGAAARRTAGERSAAARRAARTKGPEGRRQAARKAARTRRRNRGK
jgi:hypothetical protein